MWQWNTLQAWQKDGNWVRWSSEHLLRRHQFQQWSMHLSVCTGSQRARESQCCRSIKGTLTEAKRKELPVVPLPLLHAAQLKTPHTWEKELNPEFRLETQCQAGPHIFWPQACILKLSISPPPPPPHPRRAWYLRDHLYYLPLNLR